MFVESSVLELWSGVVREPAFLAEGLVFACFAWRKMFMRYKEEIGQQCAKCEILIVTITLGELQDKSIGGRLYYGPFFSYHGSWSYEIYINSLRH